MFLPSLIFVDELVWLSICGSIYYLTVAIYYLITKLTIIFIYEPYIICVENSILLK